MKIRVAVTYRVCQQWRAPVFRRLSNHPDLTTRVLHGEDIPGTKLLNGSDFTGIDHVQLKTYSLKVKSTGRDAYAILYPGVLRELSRFSPDVLLCEGGSNIFNNLLIFPWASRRKVPIIWWGLGEIPGRKFRGVSRVYRHLSLALMKRCTVFLGYSSRAVEYYDGLGFNKPVFRAVNTIDTDRALSATKSYMHQELTVHSDAVPTDARFVVLFVGALEAAKRVDCLIHAFRRVEQHIDNASLVIVGDGPERGSLEDLAQSCLLKRFKFAGRVVNGVSQHFLTSNVFVLPGLGGLAISEAMAHALPVICSVADGCEEDLVREANGRIVPAGDVNALADAIIELASNPQLCRKMGRESLRIIEDEHNIHSYVDSIVSAIRCAYGYTQQAV
jgi:glycosyltransferase involved in cell wall biosynthesis